MTLSIKSTLHTLAAIAVAVVFVTPGLKGQSVPFSTFGALTPRGLEPGSPAGSYALGDLDTVDLYSGSVNISIPLAQAGGIGNAGYTIQANVTRKPWSQYTYPCGTYEVSLGRYTDTCHAYSVGAPWANVDVRYKPAVIAARQVSDTYSLNCFTPTNFPLVTASSLTRLTVVMGDGSEIELSDAGTLGQLWPNTAGGGFYCLQTQPAAHNRGPTWVSTDGSAMTFVEDGTAPIPERFLGESFALPSGTLYFRDGRQYHFQNGYPTSIQDRTGNNVLTFDYSPSGLGTVVDGTGTAAPNWFDVIDRIGRRTEVRIGVPTTDPGGLGTMDTIKTATGRVTKVFNREYWHDCVDCGGATPLVSDLFGKQGNGYVPVLYSGTYRIQLPSLQNYGVIFNKYADIVRLTLPTGGAIEYDWHGGAPECPPPSDGAGPSPPCSSEIEGPGPAAVIARRVEKRREYAGTANEPYPDLANYTRLTRYTYTQLAGASGIFDPFDEATDPGALLYKCSQTIVPNGTTVSDKNFCWRATAQDEDRQGTIFRHSQHFFYGSPMNPSTLFPSTRIPFTPWMEGREFRTTVEAVAGSAPLRDVRNTWQQKGDGPWWTSSSPIPPPAVDPRLTQADDVIDGGKLARRVMAYDTFNNTTELSEFKYGAGTAGALLRHTKTDYQTSATNPPEHRRNLPILQTIDQGGGPLSQLRFGYDSAGNATTTEHWRNTDDTWLTTTTGFDAYGNPTSVQNPRLYTTSINYTCSNAFPHQVTNALSQVSTTEYDCSLGAPTTTTDANHANHIPTIATYESGVTTLGRLSEVTLADGAKTNYDYSSDFRTTTITQDLDAGRRTTTTTTTDGMGRVVQTRDAAGVVTATTYDALGRVQKRFNPGDASIGTSYVYDPLGRVTRVAYSDGSEDVTVYTADLALHVDPAGASTQQQTDALGRLVHVIEDPAGLNLPTSYSYDALDDLTGVTQPGLRTDLCATEETRCFGYDSLKQLRSATNPESGTITYDYDDNGNLKQRVSGGVVTTYTYDELDRPKERIYAPATTPAVTWCYDGSGSTDGTGDGACVSGAVTNGVGRLTETRNSVSKTSITGYDPVGRVQGSIQKTGAAPYAFSYGYNSAGGVTTMSYPSGRTLLNSYDAAGRLCSVSGAPTAAGLPAASCSVAASSPVTAYANAVTYTPQETLQSMVRGDQLTETWNYNARLQPSAVRVGTAFALNLYYCPGDLPDCHTNNGNPKSALPGTPGVEQIYTYDPLNRLTGMTESGRTQTWDYDGRGNRWWTGNSGTPVLPVSSFLPASGSGYDYENRIVAATHENRGNQTAIGAYGFGYDGENRQTVAQISGVTAGTYEYDGDGRRVRKTTGTATTYVYDVFGNLAAEYGGATSGPCTTCYVTVDQLGSTRMLSDASGVVKERHDYMPFGEEIFAGIGGRTTGQQYVNDGSGEKGSPIFTGQYRDQELVSSAMPSGLDFFESRYFSSAQGRFTSPDEPFVDQWAQNPQSWNLYAYGRNNPLRFVDPTGQGCAVSGNSYTDNSDSGPDCKTVLAGNGEAQKLTVGVGRDEANLIALQRIGEQLSDFHQLSQVLTGGVLGAGSVAAPLPTAIVQCAIGVCDKGNLVAAMIPLPGTGKLAELTTEHAFVKHVLVQGEFPGIRTTSQMRSLVTSILADARSLVKNLSGGRMAVWSEESSAVVIINSRNPAKSTVFQPASGKAYFDGLK